MRWRSALSVELRFVVAPVCLAAVALIFGILSPRFFTFGNFSSMGGQVSVLGALALGQMFALTVRGFDISVGAVAACSGTLAALAINKVGMIGIVAAPLAGLVFGTINGVLIGPFAIQPIIATLGVMVGTKGFALLISDNGQAVALNDPSGLTDLAYNHWLGLPPVSWALLALTLLCWFLIARTTAGRRILMLGSKSRRGVSDRNQHQPDSSRRLSALRAFRWARRHRDVGARRCRAADGWLRDGAAIDRGCCHRWHCADGRCRLRPSRSVRSLVRAGVVDGAQHSRAFTIFRRGRHRGSDYRRRAGLTHCRDCKKSL